MSNQASGTLLILLALLIWAGNALIGRMAPDAHVPPIGLNFWRWMVAFVVLLPFTWPTLHAQAALFRRHWLLWTAFGLAAVTGFNAVFYIGLQYTTMVQGTLIMGALPAMVLIAARLFLSQPITTRQTIGVLISVAGIVIIVSRGDAQTLAHLRLNIGDVWILAAVALWTVQIVLIRFLPRGMDLLAFQVASFAAGLIGALPFYLYETAAGHPMPLTPHALLSIAYTGLVASALGVTVWNMGTLRVGAKHAGYLGNLYPVFSATLGILVLGEPFHWYHGVGAVVVFAGIYLATAATATERR